MKKTLALMLAALLLTGLSAAALAEENPEDMSVEGQLVRMNGWVSEAIAWREAGNYEEEAAILETIVAMNEVAAASYDGITDEIAWPAQARWAHYQLGELYFHEEYGLLDIDQAIEHYTQAAGPLYGNVSAAEMSTCSLAALTLGDIYLSDAYGRVDVDKAIEYYERAHAFGVWDLRMEADYRLALLYIDPAYGVEDQRAGQVYLYDAAYAGHPQARALVQELLGDDPAAWAGYWEWSEDYDIAIELLTSAAEQGDVQCMTRAAYWYYAGYTGKGPYHGNAVRDVENALYWFTQAAQAGDPEAMEWIVTIYLNGDAPDIDEEQVIAWALEAVEKGDEFTAKSAMCDLGCIYQARGDYALAESWYTQAEDWVFLARLYQEEGYRDLEKAMEYMEKAAGIPEGRLKTYLAGELLALYADPEIGPLPEKAAALYKLAYENGYYRNLYNLAMLYLDEENGLQDEAQGVYWMYQSAIHGDSRAQEWFGQLLPEDGAEKSEAEP